MTAREAMEARAQAARDAWAHGYEEGSRDARESYTPWLALVVWYALGLATGATLALLVGVA